MKYLRKNRDWSFGITLHKRSFCVDMYTEYELRIDFWKWSIGVVW